MFQLWWMSNDMLKARTYYYEKVARLKWDIWFYYTAVEGIISISFMICFALGIIAFLFTNQNTYVDPFSGIKIGYFIINAIFIATLIGLNVYFINKGAEYEDRNSRLTKILILAIIAIILSITLFLVVNGSIHQNINELYNANPKIYSENIVTTLFGKPSDLSYYIPFWIMSFLITLTLVFIIYLDSTWLYRLFKKDSVLEKTEVLFDEEQNVKY